MVSIGQHCGHLTLLATLGEAVTLVTEAVQVSVTSFSSDLTLTAPGGGAECGGRGLGGARTRLVRSVRPWGIQH